MSSQPATASPARNGSTPWPPWACHLAVGLGATAVVTAAFWLTDLDLRWQALAYSPDEPHWPQGRLLGWLLVYHLGTLPGLVLGVLAAVGLGLSFVRPELVRWRYPCLFLVLLLALGPGLVINLLAKGFGGRPRPDQILEFGGLLEFRRPFEPGLPHKGFSFLCGHCSMGFLFMGLFFLLRGWKRWVGLLFGTLFGLLQGIGRMVQGAHFASDTLLGGTVMFSLAAALSPIAGRQPRSAAERQHRWRVAGATATLVLLMVAGFLLSMPVREENVHAWLEPGQAQPSTQAKTMRWGGRSGVPPPARVEVEVEVGDIVLALADQLGPLHVVSSVTGFAFPGSTSDIRVQEQSGGQTVLFRQALRGLFVEKHGKHRVSLRGDLACSLRLVTHDGQITLVGPFPDRPWLVTGSFRLSDPQAFLQLVRPSTWVRDGSGPPIRLELEAQKVAVRP